MRTLVAGTNIEAPSADYPNGRVRNLNGGAGTILNEILIGDLIQLMQKLVIDASITPNGLPDNVTNGYELMDALVEKIQEVNSVYNRKGVKECSTSESYTVQPGIGFVILPDGISGCTVTFDGTEGATPGIIYIICGSVGSGNSVDIGSSQSVAGDTIFAVMTDGTNYYYYNNGSIIN